MKILYVTTISLTMNSFFKPHIEMLVREGHSVDLACNYNDLALDTFYNELGCNFYQIDFSRSPLSPDNFKAYNQLKKVVNMGNYDIVHCHTPNASVISRLVCNKLRKQNKLRVFYTAHGFHFFKGAPLLNWLVYYPVEKFCSKFTDKLITINTEDYKLAKNRFNVKEIHYVPGVGVDLNMFAPAPEKRSLKRKELDLPETSVVLLSVGELNRNKNHQIVIRAIAELNDIDIHYVIAGKGELYDELKKLAEELNVSDRVHLLGFRSDIAELHHATDIYVLPSEREGLNTSVIEAMASGLPCAVSGARGNIDLIDEYGGIIFDESDKEDCQKCIKKLIESDLSVIGEYNVERAKKFNINSINGIMKELYK